MPYIPSPMISKIIWDSNLVFYQHHIFCNFRDDIEDEQYLLEGVKLTEAEQRELT